MMLKGACDANPEQPPATLLRLWNWADRRLFRADIDALSLRRQGYSIDSIVAESPKNREGTFLLSDSDIAKMKAVNLDVIVHFGSGVPPPQILKCSRIRHLDIPLQNRWEVPR